MRIAYIVNNVTYTSIPIEMASFLSQTDDLTILSLYDQQCEAEIICSAIAPRCICKGFSLKKRSKIKACSEFRKELMEGGYDIVHTHQTFSGSLARWILSGQKRTKIVHTVHANHHSFSIKQNLIIGSSLPFCDLIVFNSEASKNGMMNWQKWLISKIRKKVIYNGVDVSRIQHADRVKGNMLCGQYGIDENSFLFAQVGRLEPVKNPIMTVKAFDLMVRSHPESDAMLVFIGDGSQKVLIEQYIIEHSALKGRVVLTGTLQRDDVYCMMHRINEMVVPSLYEGFCNALFEGLAVGIPILASDIDVFRELIEDDMGVVLFDTRDLDDLAHAMWTQTQKRPSESEKETWRKKIYNEYDISQCAGNYRKTYLDLIAGGDYADCP